MAKRPTGKPNGRPKVQWSDEEYKIFENLCAIHCTFPEIEGAFKLDGETINRLLRERYGGTFSEIFPRFAAVGKVSLRRTIFKMGTRKHDPDFRAAKWLSIQHLGMTEKVAQKIEVEDRRVVTVNLSWADEESPGNRTPDRDAKKDPTTEEV